MNYEAPYHLVTYEKLANARKLPARRDDGKYADGVAVTSD